MVTSKTCEFQVFSLDLSNAQAEFRAGLCMLDLLGMEGMMEHVEQKTVDGSEPGPLIE